MIDVRLLLTAAIAATIASSAGADTGLVPSHRAPPLEAAVKAAYLTKFPAFVDWPGRSADDRRPLVLCVAGDDDVGEALQHGIEATAEPRPVTVRSISPADVDGCDVLYAAGPPGAARQALEGVRGRPVLTVTDSAWGGAEGMIQFVLSRGRVRFRIDAGQAARSGLAISSKLLGLASSVKR